VAPRTAALLLALFVLAGVAFASGLWALALRDDWMALALAGVGALGLRSLLIGVRAVEKGAR
jgi:hypothetical protein